MPENAKGGVVLTKRASPPLGYIPLYGAVVKVDIKGKIIERKTLNIFWKILELQ